MIKKVNAFSKKTKENLYRYFAKILEIIKEPEMGVLPGQIAFSMILSIVPILTIIGFGASIFGIDMDYIINLLNNIIPGGAKVIAPALSGASIDIGLALLFVWMFYLASNGCNSIILISNQIYGINQSNWIKRRIKAIFMTIAIMLIFILLLVFQVFGDRIVELLNFLPFYDKIFSIFHIIKGPLMWIIMFIFLRAFYDFAPDRVRSHAHLNTGTIFTALGWIVVTYIYRFIALNNSNYNLFYGALSNIAFLMLWIYFMSFLFVIGLTLNYGEEKDKNKMDKTGAVKIINNK